jgi:leucyl/phenylalanyl-tRNA--protein transferase
MMSLSSQRALGPLQKGRDLLNRLYVVGPTKCQRWLGAASAVLTQNPLIGLCGVNDTMPLSAQQMIFGYTQGLFPMDRGGKLRWQAPDPRFVLFLDELRLSPNMRRDIRKSNFTHTFDREPRAVLDSCAHGRPDTWLSERLKRLYLELFELGAMHTIETWRDGALVGGSFGVAIGRNFTGETMFHRVPEAGKSSFAFLAAHLRECGFQCIDAQAWSEHMVRFGAREVPLSDYRKVLALGLVQSTPFRESSAPRAAAFSSDGPSGAAPSRSGGLRAGPPEQGRREQGRREQGRRQQGRRQQGRREQGGPE